MARDLRDPSPHPDVREGQGRSPGRARGQVRLRRRRLPEERGGLDSGRGGGVPSGPRAQRGPPDPRRPPHPGPLGVDQDHREDGGRMSDQEQQEQQGEALGLEVKYVYDGDFLTVTTSQGGAKIEITLDYSDDEAGATA